MTPGATIIQVLDVPTTGAAAALLHRVLQLQNTVTIAKQYISILQNISRSAAQSHAHAGSHLPPDSYSFLTHPTTASPDGPHEPNAFLGLAPLVAALAKQDSEQTKAIDGIWHSEETPPPFTEILHKLDKHTESLAVLLSENRLGALHQENESSLITVANSVNAELFNLKVACFLPSTPDPWMDPYFLTQVIRRDLDVFQVVELEYTRQTIHEGEAIKQLENVLFETLAEIPPEKKRLVSRLKDVGNEAMATVEENVRNVSLDADWTSFVAIHMQQFPDDHTVKITEQNHANEDQFLQSQLRALPNLQMQYTSRTPLHRKRLTDFRKLKRALSGKKHYGTPPGTEWTLSEAGHLIEYNVEQCCLKAMWDLRKCKLGELEEDEEWGYFVLQGTRMKGGKRRIAMGKTKEYRFRLPIGEAVEAYNVLSGFLED
jgi:hypothetical protein